MSTARDWDDEELLSPGEVAGLFRVDTKTASRWGRQGRIPDLPGDTRPSVIRTPGGHIRFRWKTIRLILAGEIQMRYDADPVSLPAQPVTRR